MSVAATKKSIKTKVSGVILIDKPMGLTSQQVVSKVKYLFKSAQHDSKKAGHTGTLDPMATGLLPVCLGEATKFSHYQLDADKSYQATILLGQQTDTGDAEGQVINQASIPELSESLVNATAQKFMGAQQQIPPMYSALKKDGKKLYEYARLGIEIEREPRAIVIKAIELTLIDNEHLQLTVTCSKGTYIRVLAEDIAKELGTLAHLIALRRTKVGNFDVDKAITLERLEDLSFDQRFESLLPVDACIEIDAELVLLPEQIERVRQGQRLNVFEQLTAPLSAYIEQRLNQERLGNQDTTEDQDISEISDSEKYESAVDIRLLEPSGAFVGLGAVSLNGRLQPKKLIQS